MPIIEPELDIKKPIPKLDILLKRGRYHEFLSQFQQNNNMKSPQQQQKRNFLSIKKPKYIQKLSKDQFVLYRIRNKYYPPSPIISLADQVVSDILKKEVVK
mmetsp:Transcript_26013/g.25238  ORF Transcript_26013/g.25238 Transcript_26013/m.25238 type:complete len:101 (+) Transcript_26013:785-1087(+)